MAANATYISSANTLSQFWNSINQKWTTTPVNSQLFCFLPFGNFNQAAKLQSPKQNVGSLVSCARLFPPDQC